MSLVFLIAACAWFSTAIYAEDVAQKNVKEVIGFLKKEPFSFAAHDSVFEFGTKLRIEGFYGIGTKLLNHDDRDKVIVPGKHTFDANFLYGYGQKSHGYPVVKIKSTVRTKGTWGAPESIAATDYATIKDLDVVFGNHLHTINRHILWVREIWMELVLRDTFGLPINSSHSFTMGYFPFELGRGISLGSSYATDPDGLGYYTPNVVDQYAPGFKLSGKMGQCDAWRYDVYAEIVSNKSDTFDNVNAKILGQQYGRQLQQARGFGKINFITAARVQWTPIKSAGASLLIEPYVLFDDEKEQRIEFVGDASTRFGTLGLAFEGELNDFEFGGEVAHNFGTQKVKGWDRNTIKHENRDGVVYVVNSQVKAIDTQGNDVAGKNAVFTKTNQVIVNSAIQNEALNGQRIGDSNLKNSDVRFSNPYTNTLHGTMFVADCAYWFCRPQFKMALAVGVATGDDNPNRDLEALGDSNKDGTFDGFIGLQETYSGTRVKSAYLLSGSGRIPRVQSFGSQNTNDQFGVTTQRFTNIVFLGTAAHIKGGKCRPWTLNPNVITYWQQHPLKVFDTRLGVSSSRHARRWLGVELNLFADVKLLDDLKFFVITALFFPGSYYSDIKGKPLNSEQKALLDELDRTGINNDSVLLLNNKISFFLNAGLEYRF